MAVNVRQNLSLLTCAAMLIGFALVLFVNYSRSNDKRLEAHAWAQECGHPVFERSDSLVSGLFGKWGGLSEDRILVELVIADQSFSDLTRVSEIVELRSLNLWSTEVSDIRPIANLTNLKILNLNNTRVADIAPLQNLQNLKCVSLVGTQVADYSPLASIAGLEKVYVCERQLATAKFFPPLPDVQTIVVSGD